MQPIELKTQKGTWLAVAVQSEWLDDGYNLYSKGYEFPFITFNGNAPLINLPFGGTYTDLGLLSQLTEEQAAGIVDGFYHPVSEDPNAADVLIGYENYAEEGRYTTTLESFLSLMRASRAYTVNPFGEEMPKEPEFNGGVRDSEIWEQWQAAQSRTSKEWLILKVMEK